MYKKLEIFLEGFGVFSQNDRDILRSLIAIERPERGNFLWKAGERCENLFFINEGLVRLFLVDERGDEITVHFVNTKNFVADPESFSASAPSSVSAFVETTSEIIILNKSARRTLDQEFSEWQTLLQKVTEKSLLDKVKLRNRLFQANAKERFEIFLSTFPGVASHVKAADVASFLGMSQYTLSHLKKDLVSGDVRHRND